VACSAGRFSPGRENGGENKGALVLLFARGEKKEHDVYSPYISSAGKGGKPYASHKEEKKSQKSAPAALQREEGEGAGTAQCPSIHHEKGKVRPEEEKTRSNSPTIFGGEGS